MRTLKPSRLKLSLFLTLVFGLLAPLGSKAQVLTLQDKIDDFLWDYGGAETAPHLFPDLDEDLIGAEGTAFLDSLEYIGPIAEFAEDNLKEGSKLAKFSKGVGKFADVIGTAQDWYERAQQVEDFARIFGSDTTGPWNANGFKMTTNVIFRKVLSDFEIVGMNMTISEFINDNTTPNAISATVPDSVILSKYEAGDLEVDISISGPSFKIPAVRIPSRPLPVVSILSLESFYYNLEGDRIASLPTLISELNLGGSVSWIADGALDIPALTSITATNNPHFSCVDGVLFNNDGTVLLRYPMGRPDSQYIMPSSVKEIANKAFDKCLHLNSLVIGTNVVRIAAKAFANSSLQAVYFVGNAPAIHATAFEGITNCAVWYLPSHRNEFSGEDIANTGWGTGGYAITNFGGATARLYYPFLDSPNGNGTITITYYQSWNNPASPDVVVIPSMINGNKVTSIGDGIDALRSFAWKQGVTNVVVPNTVTNIGERAFWNCTDLKTIKLSTNLISIGESAFLSCSNLTRLRLPDGVTVIPESMAAYCPNLGTMIIGKNVTSIGFGAFHTCRKLFGLNIPATLTSIGDWAFYYCGNVRFQVDSANPSYSSDVWGSLFNKEQTTLIHGNSQIAGAYQVPSTVVNIDNTAFYGAELAVISVPPGVKSIGQDAFAECENLKAVYFEGDAPATNHLGAFTGSDDAVVYRSAVASGWGSTFAGAPVQIWIPFGYSTNNGSITLNSYNGTGGNVSLPGSFNGYPVTAIQAGLFANPGTISSLTLPDSVTSIPDNAFSGLFNLTNLVFGNNVTNIGASAFAGCSKLENLVMPNTVKTIGAGAFSNCGLTNVVISSGLTQLADSLFSGCKLQTFTVPMTITKIGASTFANNRVLQYVVIPGSVNSLGANAFANCWQLGHVYFQGNAPANDGTALNTSFYGTYVDRGSVIYKKTIAHYLPDTTGWKDSYGGTPAELLPMYFTTNKGTITITKCVNNSFPAIELPVFSSINGVRVTGIGDYAFANSRGLERVIIPVGITDIGAGPFLNCTNLINITVAPGNPSFASVSGVLFNSAQTDLKQIPAGFGGTYGIPSTVTNIGAGAFYGSSVRRVDIPSSVKGIGSEAFAFCRELTNLVVASGNTSYVFTNNVLLNAARTTLIQYPAGLGENYAIPSTVTTVGSSAFAASGVTSVVISNNVSAIASGAFGYCSRLTNFTVQAGNANFASTNGVLMNAGRTALLAYPSGLRGSLAIGTGVTSIGNLAFAGASIHDVVVPGSVNSVGTRAFENCSRMFEAYFFGNAPGNDGSAFTNSNVKVYRLASGTGWGETYGGAPVTIVPFYVQENGNAVTVTGYYGTASGSVFIPDRIFGKSVTAIGDRAFESQVRMSYASIPSTVTNIGEYAFLGCLSLGSEPGIGVQFRNSGHLNVGFGAFQGCSSMESLHFLGAGTANIEDYGFAYCTKLDTINFGGVTNIGSYAFYNCTSLRYLNIGDSVKSIGAYGFANCYLTQIGLPASLTSLGSHAFGFNFVGSTQNVSVYAYGNPPASDGTAFAGNHANIFYIPGTTWGTTYNGMTTLAIPSSFTYSIAYDSTVKSSVATITGLGSGYSNLTIPAYIPPNYPGNNGSYPVPVTKIANNAFAGNSTITNVDFPSTLLSIGDASFSNCVNLVSAALPENLMSIGNSAFRNCVKLRGITIPQYVTNIGAYAFAGCPGETNLEFGADLAYLGTNAFQGWTNLLTVYFNGDKPAGTVGTGPFTGDASARIYTLPGSAGWGTTFLGIPVSQWTQYYYVLSTNGLPVGQNSTSSLYGPDLPAPYNTGGLTNVSVMIQGYAGSQRVVTVPSAINGWSVTTLGVSAFFDRRNIDSVVLPNSVTHIGFNAFKYCSLTNILLTTNLLTIDSSAFSGCGLQNVILPDSLTNVADNLFADGGLTNIVLPKNLVSIGDSVFVRCSTLRKITIPQTVQTIGAHAFEATGLTNILLPPALTSIGNRAFYQCPLASSIVIPPGVTFIGGGAFYPVINGVIGGLGGAIYFEGNAPTTDPDWGQPFTGVNTYGIINGSRFVTGPGTAYYDPSTFGWGSEYYGLKAAPWYPYTYTIDGNAITITGYAGSGGALRVPSSIGGIPVTAISAYAFASNSVITQLTLPSTITSIGNFAFAGNTNLATVYFNGNAPTVGGDLFAGDNVQVYFLDSTSGWGATLSGTPVAPYAATGAITVNINPSNIGAKWRVDGGAFYTSGATATNFSVGNHTVSFSTVGGHWQTPNNITLPVGPFAGTLVTIPYYYVPFTYTTNGNGTLTITGYSGSGGVVYIPSTINGATVTGIAASAFANNSSITGVVIPDSVTSIGANAFANCSNLKTATIGSGITDLSGNIFLNCTNLVSVFFDGNAPTTDGTIFTGSSVPPVYYVSGATGFGNTYSGATASVIPYTFSVLGDNTVRITGYSGPGGNLTIPGTIGGLPVSDIYASVFQTNLTLTSVTIPDSVKSIEFQAFAGCSNLQSVVLGTNLQEIGSLAFVNCTSLTSISNSSSAGFPDSLRHIYEQAFYNNRQLTNINLGNGLQTLGEDALGSSVFANCTNLAEVTFGNTLTNIGPSAFAFCSALTNLTFPPGLVSIKESAFSSCTKLTNVDFGTNLTFIGNGAFSSADVRNLDLPANIYLGTNAFFACRNLQTVFFSGAFQFPRGEYVDPFYLDTSAVLYYPTADAYVQSSGWLSPNMATSDYRAAVAYTVIGNEVRIDHFVGGGSFVIPDTLLGYPVTSVADNAFGSYINTLTIGPSMLSIGTQQDTNGNLGISSIIVDEGNPNYSVNDGVLFDKSQSTLVRCPTFKTTSNGGYTVPSTVTSIADYAFAQCHIANVTLSPNVARIGNGAFYGMSLQSISIPDPDKLTILGESAFQNCDSLTNFVTGKNLPSIPAWTFANCGQLRSVTLGQSVGSIGIGAFSNCVNLASINLPSKLGSIGDGAFANCQALTTLVIPAGVPSGTNYYSIRLGSGVFAGCTGLQSVYFLGNRPNPDYGNTFAGDTQLTVYYPTASLGWSTTFDGVTASSYAPFGSLQMSFTPNLGSAAWRVDGGSWITNDGTAATLVISNVSEGSHTISFGTVENYYTPSNQVLVVINQSRTAATATYIQTPVNYTVNSANSITITGGSQLNADGFLVIPSSINGVPVREVGGGAFFNKPSLVGVILPSTVTNIGDTAFLNCTNLRHLILSTNLISIGNSAFSGCKNLRLVQIPDSVTNLGQGAFANCANLFSVQIGSGITSVVINSAFVNDSSLYNFFFNGAPPSDVDFIKSSYPSEAALYYNPVATGWGSVTAGNPTDWTSLLKFFTNTSGGITITNIERPFNYPSVIVPSSIHGLPVTTIGDGAFQSLNIYAVGLPSTVSSIGSNAFNSTIIESTFIGAAVTNIAPTAFSSSYNLASIFVEPTNPNYSDVAGILYNKAQTELITCGYMWGANSSGTRVDLTVPNGVLRINDSALSSLYYVSRINLPASLVTIGNEAFSGGGITNITVDPLNASFVAKNEALFDKSETLLIQYFGQTPKYIIPSTVQVIADGAFSYNYSLASVVIPSSVVSIGNDAFAGTSLTSLTIPNSVTNIGSRALTAGSLAHLVLPSGLKSISANLCWNCRFLTSIDIPAGVTNIGASAFAYSGLADLVIPDLVTDIGTEAFTGCNNLTTVTLGASVRNIGAGAFSYCPVLRSVNFNDGLVSISGNAFYNCQWLSQLVFPASLTYIGDNAFWGVYAGGALFLGDAPIADNPGFSGGTIYYYSWNTGWGGTFAGRTTSAYDSQFTYMENADGTLTITACNLSYGDIRLPYQQNGHLVTGIASEAFIWNTFNSVSIPASITNIASDAFAACGVASFIVDGQNPTYTSVAGSLYNTELTSLIAPADRPSFNLSSTVTNIVPSTFDACFNLTTIAVNAANPLFSSMDGVLFNKQTNVLVHYPTGGRGSYSIPDSVRTIGPNAFRAGGLGALRVPASVTNIQAHAMEYAEMRSVYFEGIAPQFDPTAFNGANFARMFYLSPASAADFTTTGRPAQEWLSMFSCQTNSGTSITIVGYNNPANWTYVLFPKNGIGGLPIVDVGTSFASFNLTGIALPNGITNIAHGAFSDCGLSDVVLPANLISIGSNAFSGCSIRNKLTLPSGVSFIGDRAFAQAFSFDDGGPGTVVFPASLKILGNEAFSQAGLAGVSLNNGLLSVGDYAFANNGLQHIFVPASVTNLGVGAFKENGSLTNAVIAASILEIKNETFSQSALVSVSLPVGLTSIGDNAFYDNQLSTLAIPTGVTNVGAYAFSENYDLKSLVLPETLVSIGEGAFAYSSVSTLVIPASVTSIGDSAFNGGYLAAAYFQGNAPANDHGTELADNYPDYGSTVAYYLQGTTGWGSTYGGVPTQMLSALATSVTNPDGTLTLTSYIGGGSVVVPSTVNGSAVTIIGTGTFANFGGSISSITLPSGIRTISSEAFTGCPALTTIVIPATATNIDIDAFAGCPGLTNIVVDPNNPYFSSVGGLLFDKDQNTLLACGGGVTGTYVIPSTVINIGDDAFMGCSGLTNIVFPPGLVSIGDPAFGYCDNLTTLTIPASVTDLGPYCFAFCPRLTSVYFEGDAPATDGTAFAGDSNVTVYYWPSAVGFGSTFGGAPAKMLRAPVAAPITVYRTFGSPLQIPVASLTSYWTDPNNAYPVTLRTVGNTSTNHVSVISNSGSISYSNTNLVNDRIFYTMENSQGMVGSGAIDIVLIVDKPVIVDQPQNVLKNQGDTASFTATASGVGVTYQWYFNNAQLSGATTTTYTIDSAQFTNAGSYFAVATNLGGSVTSSVAVLTVIPDNTAPVLKVKAPKSGTPVDGGTYSLIVTGIVEEANSPVVQYQINDNGPWTSAPTTLIKPATSSKPPQYKWSDSITSGLNPGTNTLSIRAVDLAGNTVAYRYTNIHWYVTMPLRIVINGQGVVENKNKLFDGDPTNLFVGYDYVLSTKVGSTAESVLTNITYTAENPSESGELLVNTPLYKKPTIHFEMKTNMVITFNFIPNPSFHHAGKYHGLFHESGGYTHESAGFANLKLSSKSKVTGKVYVAGESFALTCNLNLNGIGSTTIYRTNLVPVKDPLAVSLTADWENNQIIGTISNAVESGWVADLLAYRIIWDKETKIPVDYTNHYTFVIPGFTQETDGPVGYGYAVGEVKEDGAIEFKGLTADHASLNSTKVVISTNGNLAFYARGKNYQGEVMGWLQLSGPAGHKTPQGELNWIKTAGGTNYSSGLTNLEVAITGSCWTNPAIGARAMNFNAGNAVMNFSGFDITSTNVAIGIVTGNKMVVDASVKNNFSSKVSTKDGVWSGAFQIGADKTQKTKFFGAMLQDLNYGRGFFMRQAGSGTATIDPTP